MLNNQAELSTKLDRVLAENLATRSSLSRLLNIGDTIMSMQSDIIDTLKNATAATSRAKTAIAALEAENTDLKTQLAAAKTAAGDTVDPAAVKAALAETATSTKALTDAIPAGSDQVVGTTPAAPAAATGTTTVQAAVPVAPNPVADAAATSSAGTPTASLVGAKPADAPQALGAVPTAS